MAWVQQMGRRGEAFHQLTATLERVLSGREGVLVETGKRLRDIDTGQPRDFDIFLTLTVAHHTLTTAIECKDHARPVDTPLIEAFASKCGRNLIDHKVFVSSSGFTGPARQKAGKVGIVCLELREVETFHWVATSVFVELRRDFGPFNLGLGFDPDGGLPEGEIVTIVNNAGTELTQENLFYSMTNAMPAESDEVIVPRTVKVIFSDLSHIIDATGTKRLIAEAVGTTSYTVSKVERPFTLHHYTGEGLDKQIASTETEINGTSVRLMMIKGEDAIEVVAVPTDAAKS